MPETPNIVPTEALDHLARKQFWITGLISNDILEKARGILLRSIEEGLTQAETMGLLRELFEPYLGKPGVIRDGKVVTRNRLETIVRTNATSAFNAGRIVAGREAGDFLTGFEYSAVLDSRTTDVCQRLDGKVFLKDDVEIDRLRPPRHFNCRSVMVPVTVTVDVDEGDVLTRAEAGEAHDLSGTGF